jgi:uncharacterized membrane protein HdeD (DUF308 family)
MPATQPWWILMLQGMAALLLGASLFTALEQALLASINFLGLYWLILGVVAIVQIFADEAVAWIWSLLIGVLGLVTGILVLNHPPALVVVMPNLVSSLGVISMTIGFLEIVSGRTGGGLAPIILGVSNSLIGFLLLDPSTLATVDLPLAFGVLLFAQGVALLFLTLRVRP